jgi:hypothetical protein
MPYASKKQAAFMHIHHPDIAAKWHEEGHGYVKGKKKGKLRAHVDKAKRDWAVGLTTAAVGGALANQVPPIKPKRKKKGRVEKMLVPISTDPGFNQEAAQKAFDLVMKMDDDTAEMFTYMVIGEVYESLVEKNLDTLQRHLNQVLAKRLERVKQATLRSVAKGRTDGAEEMAQAIDQMEEIIKVGASQRFGYHWEETDFRRDPGSGRFTVKVKHTQKTPYTNRVAVGMGLAPTDPAQRRQYAKLNHEQRAQYQDEYRQLANFLNVVTQSTADGGDRNVFLRFQDKRGNEFRKPHTGGADLANGDLLNPNLKLLAVEASPTTLTAGGATFGLANALGATGSPGAIGMGNRAVEGLPSFSADWTAHPGDLKASNEQLYNRVGAAGRYVSEVAPMGSKPYMAAKLAEVVGSHGAEAEAVIGPSARKTAYRYRGTEKKPDKHIVVLYDRAIRYAKTNEIEGPEEELATRRPGGKPRTDELGIRNKRGKLSGKGGGPGEPPAVSQMATARTTAENRPPTWAERAVGRRIIQDQLRTKLPQGSLYNLQAESGNLPPSEGILLNRDGQIVAQAVGYGDDHYLPFNLKNLNALKGGEYIRTRSVGGLTSEDIYTGLISGARQVTVVSRSGTFSVEFEPDLRGGRRHGDKAARMTRRYEQLLDAVQSNKVSSGPVPPPVEQAIRQEVADEFPGESRAAMRSMVQDRIREYREDPDMSPEDEKIMNLVYEQGLVDNPSRDAAEWMQTARNMVKSGKKFNYQLDASGYEAAQDALAEQFPYYITSHPVIEKEGERVSTEKDRGYVEPGRGRPTAVKAGLFGTEVNQPGGGKVGSQKFSASQADYQRGRIGVGPGDRTPKVPNPTTAEQAVQRVTPRAVAPGEPVAVAARGGAAGAGRQLTPVERALQQEREEDAAVDLFNELGRQRDHAQLAANAPVLREDPTEFQASISDPAKREAFREAVTGMLDSQLEVIARERPALHAAYLRYKTQSGGGNVIGYQERLAYNWTPQAMQFGGVGYRPGDTAEQRQHERQRIDQRTKSLVTGQPLSQLTDQQLRNELSARRHIHTAVTTDPTLREQSNAEARRQLAVNLFGQNYDRSAVALMVGSPEHMESQAQDVHRMRILNQGVPDADRVGGAAIREPEAPNPLAQSVSILGNESTVRNRIAALQTLRDSEAGEYAEHEVDPHLAMGNDLLERLQGGGPVNDQEVQTFLEETESAATLTQVEPAMRDRFRGWTPEGQAEYLRRHGRS